MASIKSTSVQSTSQVNQSPDGVIRVVQSSLAEGFTQSELETLGECGWKWYLKYGLKLSSHSLDWALLVGSSVHSILEEIYGTKGKRWSKAKLRIPKGLVLKATDEAYIEYWEGIINVLMEEYAEYYKDDFKTIEITGVEQVASLQIEYNGMLLNPKGMLDLMGVILRGKINSMWDHKTAATIDASLVIGWDFRFQFMFYVWLQHMLQPDNKIRQFIVNAIRKPSIRLKSSENITMFLNRLRLDVRQQPESYFYRSTLKLTQDKIKEWEQKTLKPKLDKIAMMMNPATPREIVEMIVLNRETSNCVKYGNRRCEFFEICEKGATSNEFFTREHKHPELTE